MTSGTALDTAATLARARRLRAEADAAEVGILVEALAWAAAHEVDPESYDAATWGNVPVLLAGEGAPAVAEFCIAEFAAALGMTTDAGRSLFAHTLELAYRLPSVWAKVQDGTLRAWRGRRIAEKTLHLSPEAVAYVDAQVAPFAHKIRPIAVDRLVETAIAEFMPEYAEQTAAAAADARHVTINHPLPGFTGTSVVLGELDLADALDLDRALSAGAKELKDLGSEDSWDVRRSVALGALARGEQTLSFDKDVTLYVHLDPDSPVAEVENAGSHVLSVEQIKNWCGTATQVTIKPVLDLAETIAVNSYAPAEKLREQVILRDRYCVFPWCERNARPADIDHAIEHDRGGSTDSTNLAPLCRRHHRLKTHSPWTYTAVEPGVFLWRSPHGYSFVRDASGTRDLTPRPVEPPG